MTEPASTAVGGIALYKLGLIGLLGALIAAIVVMAMTIPKTVHEFSVALISTLMFSIGGGAFVIRWFELMAWANDLFGLIALLGLVFVCGLPGWVLVRAWFVYAEKRRSASLPDMVKEIKDATGL
ncbi:hypothetical protein LF844_09830 [Metapseudomonas lalkuanensis]|uniref:hypothetical protein n=1 Tax=Metapseudomonas lalkuanensis TaxID=2604832 RepID=UPI001CF28AFD|nr:hypothetical protein [Pseudomonas lalkuanensis]UCP00089.1 hypothetical protein LF844_09830 [Pseudomonas lalkuanensis]